nr:MAG TPA: hypothetical protein [Caudoviricetes sp.]
MNIWELVSFVAGVISLVVLLFVAWFFIVGLGRWYRFCYEGSQEIDRR